MMNSQKIYYHYSAHRAHRENIFNYKYLSVQGSVSLRG